jgi:DNA-binding transcriptional LysR family regulator
LGVAVVPELEPAKEPGVTQLPIADTALSWTLSVVTPSGRQPSRAVTALLDLMADSVRPDGLYF